MPALKPVVEPVPGPVSGPASDPAAIDPIPGELRGVLDLFSTDLREIAFPGVDAAVLRHHADEVRACARDVDRARTALDAALAAMDERTRALSALAARGLAYAKIYAADQPALAARLAAVAGAPAPAATTALAPTGPRPRGRPRKTPPQLPLGGPEDKEDSDTTAVAAPRMEPA